MDIQYLLFLQEFRNNIQDALTPFLENLSFIAISYLLMAPVFVYWAVDKKKGLYSLVSFYLSNAVNSLVKLTACIYRPWIRDPRIIPAGDAITTATGYSFPSGHSVIATSIYGGIAVIARKGLKWISVIAIILLALTGFSRNYLGVHTPQDVIVGVTEGIVILFVVSLIFKYLEKHPEKENIFLLISFIVGWCGILYITFKGYPMDYVDGELLVDPQKMMKDGYWDLASLITFPVARLIERKWIRFEPTGLHAKGLIICAIGMVPLWAIIMYLRPVMDGALGIHWGHFMHSVILVMYSVAVFPAVIKAVQKRSSGIKINED